MKVKIRVMVWKIVVMFINNLLVLRFLRYQFKKLKNRLFEKFRKKDISRKKVYWNFRSNVKIFIVELLFLLFLLFVGFLYVNLNI